MAIRFRKYKNTKDQGTIIEAIKLTPNNVTEVVAYVTKHGGTIVDESVLVKSPDLRDGEYLAVKVALVQRNYSVKTGKTKKAVRKAFRGDLIARNRREDGTLEFWRIRDAGIGGHVPA